MNVTEPSAENPYFPNMKKKWSCLTPIVSIHDFLTKKIDTKHCFTNCPPLQWREHIGKYFH